MSHIEEQELLSKKQYGFISRRSTTIQLLNYLDQCIQTIVVGGVVDTIYLDFAKSHTTGCSTSFTHMELEERC